MLLDINKEKYPILITLHKSGSTWVNSFIHKRYRRIGLVPPPSNLYTEFFCSSRMVLKDKTFVQRTDKERIALLEHLRTFGLELNHKVHVPDIIDEWNWFKEFYKDYDILVLKRRQLFSHWLSVLFFANIWDQRPDGVDVPDHNNDPKSEDILKSVIEVHNIKFKHIEKPWEGFINNIRFLNDVVIKELAKPQVIWLEDIDHAWCEKRFGVTLKKTIRPFKTMDYERYFKPEDMAIVKEKFKERFENEFQFYGYEYK